MSEEPIDLIRLAGGRNSVVLRINGKERGDDPAAPEVLAGEFLVDSPFVRGAIGVWVFPDDLAQWQAALDALDVGQDIAWREHARGPAMFIERDVEDEDRAHVTIKDGSQSLTSVTVTVPLPDAWFDDAYARLDLVRKTWPPTDPHAW